MTLVFRLIIISSDNTDLELQFSSTWRILLHLEDTAENLTFLETVVILQTYVSLLPVCWISGSSRETHLEKNLIFL